MLDSLSFWDGSESAVGRAWLNQVLQRHDIARVLEPLLLLLLHPKTHRVSIQRVQAQRHWTWAFPNPPAPKPGSEPPKPACSGDTGCVDRKCSYVLLLVLLLCLGFCALRPALGTLSEFSSFHFSVFSFLIWSSLQITVCLRII